MTETQIEYFLIIAQEMSISKASEILFVSQPAVSRQLSLLEDELGVQLFERTNVGIKITEAGRAFEQLFSEFRVRFKETLDNARMKEMTLQGDYFLGCLEGWDTSIFYPDLKALLKEKYPNVNFYIEGYNLDSMFYALQRGEIDAALITKSLFENSSDIDLDHLAYVNGLLLFSNEHTFEHDQLSLLDFKDFNFLITGPERMSSTTVDIITLCRNHGFIPTLKHVPTLSAAFVDILTQKSVLFTNDWMMAKKNSLFSYQTLDIMRDICLATLVNFDSLLSLTIKQEIITYFEKSFK